MSGVVGFERGSLMLGALNLNRKRRGIPSVAVLLLAVSTAVGASAADPEVVRRWDFDKAGDAEGWAIGNGVEELVVSGGCLRFMTNTADAYVFAPKLEVPHHLSAQ